MIEINVELMREQFREGDRKRDEGLLEPETIEKIRNLSYGPHGVDNLFDIYFPKGTSQALPTIISIHGGGFFYGDKEIYRFYTMFLATQGFTVVNFNYRLAPTNTYPAPLEDINTLMNWLIENGKEYFVDLNNLFLVGDSAGGQLAEQYATISSNPTYRKLFDFECAAIHFNAVALNCGVYFVGQKEEINKDFPYYFGEELENKTKSQFPVEKCITNHFPPAFIMTASHDFLKDVAKPLAEILQSKEIPVSYHLYKNADESELGHVFHLDQKSELAKKCNLSELAFFKKFIK